MFIDTAVVSCLEVACCGLLRHIVCSLFERAYLSVSDKGDCIESKDKNAHPPRQRTGMV
jgi:hypothetical protein